MNISLTPTLDKWVENKVKSGQYTSSSEVIREGIRLLQQKEEHQQNMLNELKKEVQVGLNQLDSGKKKNLTPSVIEKIKKKGRSKT